MVNPSTDPEVGFDCSGLKAKLQAHADATFFNFTPKTEPVPFQQLLSDAIRNIEKQSDEWHDGWGHLGSMVPPPPQPVTGDFVRELEADLGEPVTAAEAAEILSEIVEEEFSL